jgi:hypothetical protein
MSFCNSMTNQGKPCKNGANCHLHSSEPESCSICLNPARKTRGVKDLRCGHRFHAKCIQEWSARGGNTCPMCRKSMDDSKYKVSIRIENTEQNISNAWDLPDFSVTSLFGDLGLDDLNFTTSEVNMNVNNMRDMEEIMRDLGIRIANLDSFIFDAE